MVKETMTVHEALCELKVLGKRIDTAIAGCVPIATREHDAQKVRGVERNEFATLAKSNHQSAMDLIRRRSAIKAAISQYNAAKVITVGDKQYTIAQAIWMMEHGCAAQQELINRYTNMLIRANDEIEYGNGQSLNDRAERAAKSVYESKEKADTDKYLKFILDYKQVHMLELEDPLNIREVIAELQDEVNLFTSKVDSAIQVANATTVLEIEY